MKAKVIATGEILKVEGRTIDFKHVFCYKQDGKVVRFKKEEVELIREKKINWKQYRVELSKAAMQGILSNEFLLKRLEQTVPEIADKGNKDVIASLSVEYADAVITKLKE